MKIISIKIISSPQYIGFISIRIFIKSIFDQDNLNWFIIPSVENNSAQLMLLHYRIRQLQDHQKFILGLKFRERSGANFWKWNELYFMVVHVCKDHLMNCRSLYKSLIIDAIFLATLFSIFSFGIDGEFLDGERFTIFI